MRNKVEISSVHGVLFFTLIGFGLRLQKLSFQPLWGDEGWSFFLVTQSLPQLLALTANDIHPPFYYILLKAWLFVIGLGAEEARFFSVVVGTVLVPILSVVGQRLFDTRVGLVAAAVTTVMPMAIYYSQEVRMYGLVTLLGAMSVYFFISGPALTGVSQNLSGLQRARNWLFLRSAPALAGLQGAKNRGLWPVSRPSHPRARSETGPSGLFLGSNQQGSSQWAYIITTTAALYTHYYAAFIIFFQLLYIFLSHLRWSGRLRGQSLYPALRSLIYIGLLYLPWVIYIGIRLPNYVENKRDVEGYISLSLVRFLGDHFVAFSLGHIPADLRGYAWLSLPIVVVASLGFMTTLSSKNRSYLLLYLYLSIPLLMGYAVNRAFPFTPRFFERTLLLAAPAYWLFVGAGFIWLWKRQYLLMGTAVVVMLPAVTLSLFSFYTVPRYPHEDYRPLLKNIAARATPEDTVLASYQWQVGFYQAYLPAPRPKLFIVPGWGRGWSAQATENPQLITDLTDIFEQSPRLWFPAYQAGGHIWEDEAEIAIANLGYPALLQWYSPQTKLTLAGAARTPLVRISTANFEDRLSLLKATVGGGTYEAGRDIVPIELIWQKMDHFGSEHRVNLRLVDAVGRTWATRDSHPRAGQAFSTDMSVGDIMTDHHGLLTPAGAPPGQYRLLLSVRRMSDAHPLDLLDEAGQPLGAELPLTEINLITPHPPVGVGALPVQTATNAIFGQQVRLVGYSLGPGPFKAGESLPLTLFWESLVDHPGSLMVLVQLQDASGQAIVSHRKAPIWPTTEWVQGTILHDPHDFILPPTLPPGEYRLVVGLLAAEQDSLEVKNNLQLLLTTIATIDRPHVFEAPTPQIELAVIFGEQAKLIGLDLPRTRVKAGERLPLTLYWQAEATFDKNWTVFVHLTNCQGQIISQQDQIPGGGQFPTTGWVSGEYLVDTYNLLIPADVPPGHEAYQLHVGLYDANDFTRLPVMEAGESVADHMTLESWPVSVE